MAQGNIEGRESHRAAPKTGRARSFPTKAGAEEWLRSTGGGKVTSRTSYRARYRSPEGRFVSETFAKKGDAERWLNAQLTAVAVGDWVDPSSGKVTFEAYARQWLEAQPHRASTATSHASRLSHVLPVIGDRAIAAVKTSEVRGLVGSLSDSMAPSSVEAVYRLTASIFKAAVEDRLITRTPCKGVTLPRPDGRQVVPLTVDQYRLLESSMTERLRPAVVLAAGSGLRQAELMGLTVDRVDWLRRTVRVDRQLIGVEAGGPVFGPPKTPASVRTVPVPTFVLEALTEHLRSRGEGPGRLLFVNQRGGPVLRNRASDAWQLAAGKAKVDARGWHDLRHFYASLLIEAGESVKVVQKRLGHKSALETLDTYGHLWPDSEESTRAAVERFLGPTSAPPAAQSVRGADGQPHTG
jgi:integrase